MPIQPDKKRNPPVNYRTITIGRGKRRRVIYFAVVPIKPKDETNGAK